MFRSLFIIKTDLIYKIYTNKRFNKFDSLCKGQIIVCDRYLFTEKNELIGNRRCVMHLHQIYPVSEIQNKHHGLNKVNRTSKRRVEKTTGAKQAYCLMAVFLRQGVRLGSQIKCSKLLSFPTISLRNDHRMVYIYCTTSGSSSLRSVERR